MATASSFGRPCLRLWVGGRGFRQAQPGAENHASKQFESMLVTEICGVDSCTLGRLGRLPPFVPTSTRWFRAHIFGRVVRDPTHVPQIT